MKRKNGLKNGGFTLLEIVVSLGILAVGILGIFSLIPTGVEQTTRGKQQGKAVILAQSKMEEIIGKAAKDWEAFCSSEHYRYSGSNHYKPLFAGPNADQECINWGWTRGGAGSWVHDLGYQWVWYFVDPPDPSQPVALITLTVSWPQKWSRVNGAAEENALLNQYRNENTDYFKNNNIQFIRLISYVSKGI
jgi:prepilin-type N-terminal cleavage/methylation domain-containing protein